MDGIWRSPNDYLDDNVMNKPTHKNFGKEKEFSGFWM